MNDPEQVFQQLLGQLKREARIKICFAADINCSKKIIRAHSVQNNRILTRLADNGEVIQLAEGIVEEGFEITPRRVGRRVASVATNFCGIHDTNIFIPIEKRDFTPGDLEQEFLFAYRAYAKEYYAKLEQTLALKAALDKFDAPEIKEMFTTALTASEVTLKEMGSNRIKLNKALSCSNFKQIHTYRAEFWQPCPIAVSSSFALEHDLNGKVINNLVDHKSSLKFLALTIFPQDSKTNVLISCFRNHKKDYSCIPKQILAGTKEKQKVIISNLVIAYVENLFISPVWWENKPQKTREAILKLFNETIKSDNNIFQNMLTVNLLE